MPRVSLLDELERRTQRVPACAHILRLGSVTSPISQIRTLQTALAIPLLYSSPRPPQPITQRIQLILLPAFPVGVSSLPPLLSWLYRTLPSKVTFQTVPCFSSPSLR